jgi:hypothetical protein
MTLMSQKDSATEHTDKCWANARIKWKSTCQQRGWDDKWVSEGRWECGACTAKQGALLPLFSEGRLLGWSGFTFWERVRVWGAAYDVWEKALERRDHGDEAWEAENETEVEKGREIKQESHLKCSLAQEWDTQEMLGSWKELSIVIGCFLLLLFCFVFWVRVSLGRSGWTWTHDPPASVS